jgi:hypothetical protein
LRGEGANRFLDPADPFPGEVVRRAVRIV